MNKQFGFIYNAENCIGCKACEIACRNQNNTEKNVFWRRVDRLNDQSYISRSCYHCSSPECFRVCPENAFTKRNDGIVIIDSNRCNGCKLCLEVCPYEAPQFDFYNNKVTKCNFCYERIDAGLDPACVSSCTTKALTYADLKQFYDPLVTRELKDFPSFRITQPSVVFYPPVEKRRYFL